MSWRRRRRRNRWRSSSRKRKRATPWTHPSLRSTADRPRLPAQRTPHRSHPKGRQSGSAGQPAGILHGSTSRILHLKPHVTTDQWGRGRGGRGGGQPHDKGRYPDRARPPQAHAPTSCRRDRRMERSPRKPAQPTPADSGLRPPHPHRQRSRRAAGLRRFASAQLRSLRAWASGACVGDK